MKVHREKKEYIDIYKTGKMEDGTNDYSLFSLNKIRLGIKYGHKKFSEEVICGQI